MLLLLNFRKQGFQFTLPCGERRNLFHVFLCASWISIHAPVWGATFRNRSTLLVFKYFNSRSRVGSDEETAIKMLNQAISIHAPVWGATCCGSKMFWFDKISIHAPVWGATENSTKAAEKLLISIHAPVWGATTLEEE